MPVSSLAESVGEDTLHVLFTGDVLLDRGVRQEIDRVGIDSVMGGVKKLFQANDAVMVNLECPLSSNNHPVSKQIVFRADTTMAMALHRNGVTYAALANNHSIDQGFTGLSETAECLKNNGIGVVGYGKDYAQRITPAIITKGEVKVAVFNDNVVPLENWPRRSSKKSDILSIPIDSLCVEMQRFHKENPNFQMVVFLHWGTEFSTNPNNSQKIDALKLAKAGASAIIGHHPHVIQHVEYVGNVPVFFSLGNFIFDQKRENTDEGLAVELIFTHDGLISTHSHQVKIKNCKPEVITDCP